MHAVVQTHLCNYSRSHAHFPSRTLGSVNFVLARLGELTVQAVYLEFYAVEGTFNKAANWTATQLPWLSWNASLHRPSGSRRFAGNSGVAPNGRSKVVSVRISPSDCWTVFCSSNVHRPSSS